DSAELTGRLSYGSGDNRVEFGYTVVRLWQEPVEDFLQAGLAILPLATLCKLSSKKPVAEALRDVVQAIDRRLGLETSPAEAARLMTANFILTGLRIKKSELPAIFQGVHSMQEEMTAYDEWMEELTQAESRGFHRILLRQGRNRFGPADAETEAALT